MISIIVPIHNDDDNLHIFLWSILNQTFQDFEVIFIDDNSTDSSTVILEFFSKKDSRFKIYKNETKKGVEYCKNKGLGFAKGKQIIFLNTVGCISEDFLERISYKNDVLIEVGASNLIEFNNINLENEIINIKNEFDEFKKSILTLQKKLGKFTKPEILNKLINHDYSKLTLAIKSPHLEGTTHWGDYFFSIALKKSFEKLGFNVLIQEREHWYDEKEIDIAFVLRGLVEYDVDYSNINIMWNISHPDLVSKEEYEKYDQVFISSKKYANKIKNKVNTVVKPLLQCTDPEVFYPEIDTDLSEDILFVGITRGVYREIIKDILKTNNSVSIYGMGWEAYIDEKYIKGQFIPNEDLHKYYSSCKILLNDHWADMRHEDFPSNRLFDALACGTFVISDRIPSAETLFEGSIITYDSVDDLNEKINYYLSHEKERIKIAEKGRKIVLEHHTFDDRVNEILEALKEIKFN